MSQISKREPSRSRFRVVAAVAALFAVTGCSSHFGPGVTELPAESGWQPLPIESWVLNDGLAAKAMVFCPRDRCLRQGFAALITLEGREADELERTLASAPARLARAFAAPSKPKSEAKSGSKAAAKARSSVTKPRSSTHVTRYVEADAKGLLVEIRALGESGKRAVTAILSGRSGGKLAVAVGVSTDPEAARNQAKAAWRDR
jgi:hypothetical protein